VLGLLEVVRTLIAIRAAARFDISLSDLAINTDIRNGTAAGGSTQPLRDIASLRSLITSKALFALLDLPFAALFIIILYFIHPPLFWATLAGAVAPAQGIGTRATVYAFGFFKRQGDAAQAARLPIRSECRCEAAKPREPAKPHIWATALTLSPAS
jgi:hypothetical protein